MRDASSGQAGRRFERRLRLAFLILCCANLAAFSMTASQSLLPIVMARDGVAEAVAGAALSASVVPVVLVGLLCGRYIARIGAALVLACGYGLAIAANLSLDLLPAGPATLFGMRMVHGVALGLITPAALILGHHMASRLGGFSSFAIFTSTIPGAQMIGPPLGDWWLQTYGRTGYFLATSSPGALALLLMCVFMLIEGRTTLPDRSGPGRTGGGYLPILRRPVFRTPLLAHIAPALFWGYVLSFLTMMLQARGLSLPAFYQAMTVAVIATRIGIAGRINTAAPRKNLTVCLAGIMLALLGLNLVEGLAGTLFAGLLFGASFGVMPPLLTFWVAGLADEADRPQAVALGNTIFNGVTFLTAALIAAALPFGGIVTVNLWFAILAGGGGILILMLPQRPATSD
jgi:predicted MFS family arabinose efflux permease